MKQFQVLGFSFLVPRWWFMVRSSLLFVVGSFLIYSPAISEEPRTKNIELEAEIFRPEAGQFPPLEEALSYRGELVFVDHANRRGSLRVQGAGTYFRNAPHPFAMLPYGIIRYHGAPADLRDIPLGTVLHVRGFPFELRQLLYGRPRNHRAIFTIRRNVAVVSIPPLGSTGSNSRGAQPLDWETSERKQVPTASERE